MDRDDGEALRVLGHVAVDRADRADCQHGLGDRQLQPEPGLPGVPRIAGMPAVHRRQRGLHAWLLEGQRPRRAAISGRPTRPARRSAAPALRRARYNSLTLLQALELGGGTGVAGATQNLLRAAVAALLNAANGDVDYPFSAAAIVTEVNLAIASGNRVNILSLASLLDSNNNLGCPIDISRVTA